MSDLHKTIKKDLQIWKFSFYGLFKNLRFFEPYLYIYFLQLKFSLFDIGILFAIREITVYILEVPTGVFADNYGKKKALYLCFTSYIVSFIFFFFTKNLYLASLGMIFYGIGDAFRSGTHKALIYAYLEKKGWFSAKTFVYGRTRSFSLLGSAISSFLSIIFVLSIPRLKWIFIITIIPYILDFILIMTYPDYIDEKTPTKFSIREFFSSMFFRIKDVFRRIDIVKVLLSSSLYDGIFKTTKDYIQPILKNIIMATGVVLIASLSPAANVKIILGIIYGIFYLASSSASRNVYKLLKYAKSYQLLNILFDLMGGFFLVLYFAIKADWALFVIILYFILYLMKNARRPLVVDVLGDVMKKEERATVLSLDSEIRAIFVALFAPLFGFVSDKLGIHTAFLLTGIFMLIVNRLIYIRVSENLRGLT